MEVLSVALMGLLGIGLVGTGLIMVAAQLQDSHRRRHEHDNHTPGSAQ